MFKCAKWIWYEPTSTKNSFGEFYGSFSAAGGEICKISCDGDYTLFINGKYVSSNQYGDFEHYKSVDVLDLTPYTVTEENHIGILVWHFGKDSQRYKKYSPGVICEITSGENVVFATNESTLCRNSPSYESGFEREISFQLGFSYGYDSTKEDLWALGKSQNMKKAYPVDKKSIFVPRPNKRLSLGSLVKATKIGENLYDLGREYVGLLSFALVAKEMTKITVSYGECLENGHVKRKIGARDFSIDYTAQAGKNEYTHYMLRFACRYLEIEGDADISYIGLIPQYYPVTPKKHCLEGLDGQIYDICVNTLRLSMMEHYVDCPWREQCLYAFDSRNQMLSGYHAFEGGNFDYARSNLLLMSKDARIDGLLSICYPCGIDLTIPSFSLYYILSVKEYIEHSGDRDFINLVDHKLKEILGTFLSNAQNGLVCTFKNPCHWNFYDWSPKADGYVKEEEKGKADAMATLLTIFALDNYEKICTLCSLPFPYEGKAQELRSAAKATFFDTGSGLFVTDSTATELVNAFAIKTGVAEGEVAQHICQCLAEHSLVSCSLSMKCFVYDALLKTDREKYKSFIIDDIRATYTPMLETGTVWETVVGHADFDNAGSLCHGWSATPIYYYNLLND